MFFKTFEFKKNITVKVKHVTVQDVINYYRIMGNAQINKANTEKKLLESANDFLQNLPDIFVFSKAIRFSKLTELEINFLIEKFAEVNPLFFYQNSQVQDDLSSNISVSNLLTEIAILVHHGGHSNVLNYDWDVYCAARNEFNEHMNTIKKQYGKQ